MNWVNSLTVIYLLVSSAAAASEIRFFDSGIDYWTSESMPAAQGKHQEKVSTSSLESSRLEEGKPAFDWKKTMDPKNDDFFREGDYTPPAAFMEVARDPSDENIRLWTAYIEKKNALASRLEARLQEYAAKSGTHREAALGANAAALSPISHSAKPIGYSQEIKRFQFRMYFDSQCPHCINMMGTLRELAGRGFSVEAKQTDDLPFDTRDLPFAVTKASREEVKYHGVSSVPFLLAADLKSKVVYKMTGYKDVASIFHEILSGASK